MHSSFIYTWFLYFHITCTIYLHSHYFTELLYSHIIYDFPFYDFFFIMFILMLEHLLHKWFLNKICLFSCEIGKLIIFTLTWDSFLFTCDFYHSFISSDFCFILCFFFNFLIFCYLRNPHYFHRFLLTHARRHGYADLGSRLRFPWATAPHRTMSCDCTWITLFWFNRKGELVF